MFFRPFLPSRSSERETNQNNMKNLLLSAGLMVAIALMFGFTKPADDKAALEKLSGTYADPAPYSYGKAWGKRVFTFDKGKWTLLFTLGLDPELKMQVFTFRTAGTYKVLDKSKAVDHAYNAVFYEDKKMGDFENRRSTTDPGIWICLVQHNQGYRKRYFINRVFCVEVSG
jgi:hypothetical protein